MVSWIVAVNAMVSLPVVVLVVATAVAVVAVAMMMEGMLRVLSILASLTMFISALPFAGQAVRTAVISFFHKI